MYSILHAFSGLAVALASIATGMSLVIIVYYWKIFRLTRDGTRLLPLHVMGIGISYIMFAMVAITRIGNPPPITDSTRLSDWWTYPFITLAFLIGDVALTFILTFIHNRGTRYPKHKGESRQTDNPITPWNEP